MAGDSVDWSSRLASRLAYVQEPVGCRYGVGEGRLGQDLAGGDPAPEHLDDRLTGAVGEAVAAPVRARRRGG